LTRNKALADVSQVFPRKGLHRSGVDGIVPAKNRPDVRLRSLELYSAEAFDRRLAQGGLPQPRRLKLVPVDDDQASRVSREIIAIVAIIETVVDENGRPVVVAESAPTVVVISMVPMDPSRTPAPMLVGNPVPAEAEPPAPTAVMIGTPTPRLVRNPGPADDGIPNPAAIVIGPPIVITVRRNPDIAVGSFIGPAAVAGKLVLIIIIFFGEVGLCQTTGIDRVAAGIPVAEIIAP